MADTGRTAWAAAASVLGLFLPLSFALKLDSLALHQRTAELVQTYGAAWLLHFPVALGAAALTALAAAILARLRPRLVPTFPAILLIAGFAVPVYLGLRLWEPSRELVQAFPSWVGLGAALLIAIAAGIRWPDADRQARPLVNALAGAGLLASTYALLQQPAAASPRPLPAPADRPDILLITVDTLAFNRTSLGTNGRDTTPGLKALAARATLFPNMHAAANFTTPSIASMLTGHGSLTHRTLQLAARLPDRYRDDNLLSRLRDGGYAIHVVTTNAWAGPARLGIARHVDRASLDRVRTVNPCREKLTAILPSVCAAADIGLLPRLMPGVERATAALLGWGEADHFDPRLALEPADRLWKRPADGRPLFLWIHLLGPHDPYATQRPFVGRFNPSADARTRWNSTAVYGLLRPHQGDRLPLLADRYDEAVRATDAAVAAFLGRLDAAGRLDNAVVVFASDHGESFERGYGGHTGPALHEALLRVPLIIRLPMQAGAQVSDANVGHEDLMPTLMELAGLPAPAGEGRSLVPALRGRPVPPRTTLSATLEHAPRAGPAPRGRVAVFEGRLKYVHGWGEFEDHPLLRTGLFDLATDPGERQDLSAVRPQEAARLRRLAARAVKRAGLQ